jgi:hypothetical protein
LKYTLLKLPNQSESKKNLFVEEKGLPIKLKVASVAGLRGSRQVDEGHTSG